MYSAGTIWGDDMLELLIKWKPDWLYEAMPVIYFVVGVAAILYFDNPAGYGAGVVLMPAACLIWTMWLQHRKQEQLFREAICIPRIS